jgi:hypothetical protein
MNVLPGSQRFTGSAVIGSGTRPIQVYSVTLVSGGSASTCSLTNNGATGTNYAQIDGTASKAVVLNWAGGLRLPTNGYFTADGNISYAVVTFDEVF